MRREERLIITEYLSRRSDDKTLDASELDHAKNALGEPGHREYKRIIRDLKSAGEMERLCDLLESRTPDCRNTKNNYTDGTSCARNSFRPRFVILNSTSALHLSETNLRDSSKNE